MKSPRALVLRTAGTNCEQETLRALELAGARAELASHRRILAEPARLDDYSILVLPGGFSFGDDIGAGRVWGFDMRRGLRSELERFVERGGFVLGICNGFQVLVDSGLLDPPARGPGGDRERAIALYDNTSNHYECRWVTLASQDCASPAVVPGEHLPVPVAHGEGRFVVRDGATLARLVENRQIAYRYVAEDGGSASYPRNPNGSVFDVAGICDPSGRVLGLMPHPERNVSPWHHPRWTRMGRREEGEGLALFRRLVDAAADAPASSRSESAVTRGFPPRTAEPPARNR